MTDPALSFSTPNGRYYQHPTRAASVPSITNIIKMKDKPAIAGYKVRVAAEYAADNIEKLTALDRSERITLIKGTQYQYNEAAAIGDTVHGWIDEYVKGNGAPARDALDGEPVTARRMWKQFIGFVDNYKPVFTLSEFTVWSDSHGYAGTGDLAFQLGDYLILCDTKTGKGVYDEVGFQTAALAHADFILKPDGTEEPLPRFDKLACLHIRPTYSKLIPILHAEECFHAFLGYKAGFDFQVEFGGQILAYAPKIEIPVAGA